MGKNEPYPPNFAPVHEFKSNTINTNLMFNIMVRKMQFPTQVLCRNTSFEVFLEMTQYILDLFILKKNNEMAVVNMSLSKEHHVYSTIACFKIIFHEIP